MIKDLMELKKQIDIVIETYKDLHPDDDELTMQRIHEDYETESIKTKALKRVRENYYEDTFSKKQRKKTTEPSERSSSLCVYGDS